MYYDMKESGKRIRQLRLEKGLTQEKAANALNIDQSFYGRIESGAKGCSVDLFIRLSDLFGVSLDHLVLGRYLANPSRGADMLQLKADIGNFIRQLEIFQQSL